MKKIVKILAVVSLLAIATSTFSSCSVVRYNAKIYSDIGEKILPSFRENSPIYNKYNMSAPESRSFIVADESTYNSIFEETAFDVDFDKEMLLVCTFSDVYKRRYYVDRVSLKENNLNVYIRIKSAWPGVKDACQPYQRWLVVKMRSTDIDSVTFYEWKFDVYNGGKYEKI